MYSTMLPEPKQARKITINVGDETVNKIKYIFQELSIPQSLEKKKTRRNGFKGRYWMRWVPLNWLTWTVYKLFLVNRIRHRLRLVEFTLELFDAEHFSIYWSTGRSIESVKIEQATKHFDMKQAIRNLNIDQMIRPLKMEQAIKPPTTDDEDSLNLDQLLELLMEGQDFESWNTNQALELWNLDRAVEFLTIDEDVEHWTTDQVMDFLNTKYILESLDIERIAEALGTEQSIRSFDMKQAIRDLNIDQIIGSWNKEKITKSLNAARDRKPL